MGVSERILGQCDVALTHEDLIDDGAANQQLRYCSWVDSRRQA